MNSVSDVYLLDTNVLSELVRKRPDPGVVEKISELSPAALMTSVICVMELRYGASLHAQGKALWARLFQEVLRRVRIRPIGTREALMAGDILATLKNHGTPIGIEDVLIGATALAQDWTLVTRNLKHFERIDGIKLVSWHKTAT